MRRYCLVIIAEAVDAEGLANSVHAIIAHTRTSKSTDYCPNCTRKCVINYTNTCN